MLLVTFSGQSREIHVVTGTWQSYAHLDGKGYFLDILREVFPSPDYTLKITHMPYQRALYMIEAGRADITTGVYLGDLPDKLIARPAVDNDKVDAIVSRELAETWQGLQSLRDKSVIAKIGYNFDKSFSFPIEYAEKSNLLGMMKMLKVGRADAVLDYDKDIKQYWQQSGLGEDFVIIESVISKPDFFAFSQKSNDLKAKFEDVLPHLIRTGKILEIGKRYDLDLSRLPHSH